MFYAMWLLCIVGMEPECKEIKRDKPVLHKTEEACMVDAVETTQRVMQYMLANGLTGQVGHKCVLDKDSV